MKLVEFSASHDRNWGGLHRIKRWAGLRGGDRVTIWDDGSVTDEFGSIIGNIYDEIN